MTALIAVATALSFLAPLAHAPTPIHEASAPVGGLSHSGNGPACSKIGHPSAKSEAGVYFIGEASPDTVLAGAAGVDYELGGGHFGGGGDHRIHGQVVEVELFGTDTRFDAASTTRVVVVPWDYDESCRTLAWTASSRFLRVGARGFYNLHPRRRDHWVDGLPTFDAFNPQSVAYPDGGTVFRRTLPGPTLDADQVFALYELAPTVEAIERFGREALEEVLAWADRHPDRAGSNPARFLIGRMIHVADDAWARRIEPPVAGTYEVRIEMPSGRNETLFLRTAEWPDGAERLLFRLPPGSNPSFPELAPMPEGYGLWFWWGHALRDLPRDSAEATMSGRGAWSLAVSHAPRMTGDTVTWRGRFEPSQIERWFPSDPEVEAVMSEWRREFRQSRDEGEHGYPPLVFWRARSGASGFDLTIQLEDGRALRMLGRRVSMASVEDRRR